MTDVTQILNQIEHGDPAAADRLLQLVYGELRQLAAAKTLPQTNGLSQQITANWACAIQMRPRNC